MALPELVRGRGSIRLGPATRKSVGLPAMLQGISLDPHTRMKYLVSPGIKIPVHIPAQAWQYTFETPKLLLVASEQAKAADTNTLTHARAEFTFACCYFPSKIPARFDEASTLTSLSCRPSGMSENVLITFDVDGTLMQSSGLQANLLHKKAFSHAFLQVFGVEGTIDAIKHHGSTDPMVILNTLEHYGIPQETAAPKLEELKAKMVDYAIQHASEVGEGLEVLPGVRNLLEFLSRQPDVVIGLVTGNLEDIAWLKMEGLGIRQYFSLPNFGGFGSDHIERGELVRIAAARAEQLFPGGFRLRAHVGDTPNDIRAAEFGGALAIGVCTGIFTQKDLREASHSDTPAVILDNLQNLLSFTSILGLSSRDF